METNDEAATFSEFAFYLDSAVVQFDNSFGQSQSDAGANAGGKAIHLFRLIEAVEYLIYLFGVDAATGISHTDDGFVTFGGDAKGYGILMALDRRLFITFCICFWSYHTSRLSLSFSNLKLICLLLAYSIKIR